uniref:HCLS1-binding protein 3 n=1 Tax=Myxine glutinosa TaxID=7769 RepID=UPI00358EF61C
MPEATVTTRPLQNTASGLDLCVPEYQEVREGLVHGHVLYRVVVVSRLAAFKSTKHGAKDIVQLTVSRSYSEFQELHHQLGAQYPGIRIPPMPRNLLVATQRDILDRRDGFDSLLRAIACEPHLAKAPETLAFLGAKTLHVTEEKHPKRERKEMDTPPVEEDDLFFQDKRSAEDEEWNLPEGLLTAVGSTHAQQSKRDLIMKTAMGKDAGAGIHRINDMESDGDSSDEALDPLGVMKKPKQQKSKSISKVPNALDVRKKANDGEELPVLTIAPAGLETRRIKAREVDLFQPLDLEGGAVRKNDPLLLPSASYVFTPSLIPDSVVKENDADLFSIPDDLDGLMIKPKPKVPPKPAGMCTNVPSFDKSPATVAPKPAKRTMLPKKPVSDVEPDRKVENMSPEDILSYIEQQTNEDYSAKLF